MSIEIKKLQDLDYNELVTLSVIEGDERLSKMFTNEIKISFNILKTLSQEGNMNENTKEFIRDIFDKIICTQKSHINKYLNAIVATSVTPPVAPSPSITKEKKLPRRYGKDKIIADIEKQGGKPTPLQNAMLRVNDLKNIYINLAARGVKDMVGGTNLLSVEDCRDIDAVVLIVERKLENILKRKK